MEGAVKESNIKYKSPVSSQNIAKGRREEVGVRTAIIGEEPFMLEVEIYDEHTNPTSYTRK